MHPQAPTSHLGLRIAASVYSLATMSFHAQRSSPRQALPFCPLHLVCEQDAFGGNRLHVSRAVEATGVISSVPLYHALVVAAHDVAPITFRHPCLRVDVAAVHEAWQTRAQLHWPAEVSTYLRNSDIAAIDRLATWLAWLRIHAPRTSAWGAWCATLPTLADVRLPHSLPQDAIARLSSTHVRELCRAECEQHQARCAALLQGPTSPWARLQSLAPIGEQQNAGTALRLPH